MGKASPPDDQLRLVIESAEVKNVFDGTGVGTMLMLEAIAEFAALERFTKPGGRRRLIAPRSTGVGTGLRP